MTQPSPIVTFPAEIIELGLTRAGQAIALWPMAHDPAEQLGAEMAAFGPWRQYGFSAVVMAQSFFPTTDNGTRYQVRVDGDLAGGMIIRDPWLVGPYLQTIAIRPGYQNGGLGGLMLGWFEARARLSRQRNIWLCVSAFNSKAQKFYHAHGWEHAADLPDLIRDGYVELLMRKRLHLPGF